MYSNKNNIFIVRLLPPPMSMTSYYSRRAAPLLTRGYQDKYDYCTIIKLNKNDYT